MRHQEQTRSGRRQQQTATNPQRLYSDLALLITETRLPDLKNGRVEGVHCPCPTEATRQHVCDPTTVPTCAQASRVGDRAAALCASGLPLSVQTVLIPEHCAGSTDCLRHGVLLETWTIETRTRRYGAGEGQLTPCFLVQAIRSYLHFSQLSAWLIKYNGMLPTAKTVYRVGLPGEFDDGVQSVGQTTTQPLDDMHLFPACPMDRNRCLSVEVRSLKRQEESLSLGVCPICSTPQHSASPPSLSSLPIAVSAHSSTEFNDSSSTPPFVCGSEATTTSPLTPITPSASFAGDGAEVRSPSTWASNPLFGLDRAMPDAQSSFTPESHVRFYVSTDDDRYTTAMKSTPRSLPRANSGRTTTTILHRRRLISQKILISDAQDAVNIDLDDSEGLLDDILSPTKHCRSANPAAGSAVDAEEAKKAVKTSSPVKKSPSIRKATDVTSERKTRQNVRHQFHQGTGLPLTSSPAPLKRNQHSFDYDASLATISGIRNALYNDHDSGSSDSEGGTTHQCKSAPASTHLLGNFEESALNGRIKPFGTVEGFLLVLAASGSFCPPHVTLPVTTFFFNISDDNAPSPYLGHCNLEAIGRKGYHVPKKGTVQATLFNPHGTVVKMFVVRYDLSDMPGGCQTFVRQRTFFMPSAGSLAEARNNRCWLRYLIHLRFASSRSSKLYLHTDIRTLFFAQVGIGRLQSGDRRHRRGMHGAD